MILGVFGPRDYLGKVYEDRENVFRWMNHVRALHPHIKKVISGGSKGVEHFVSLWAAGNKIELEVIPPSIGQHGPIHAFTVRNNEITDVSDQLVVFWDGESKYLIDNLIYATQAHKPTLILPMSAGTDGELAQT